MARNKKYDNGQIFTEPDNVTRPITTRQGIPPSAASIREIMSSEANRLFASQVIGELRKSWRMQKVNSNQELIERIDEYFEMIQDREVPPTVEEMALYCGYTASTLTDWQNGRNKGFRDEPEPGLTTSMIIKKAKEFLHAFDAVMAETGRINFLAYCFRSKNYYNMVDKTEITVSPNEDSRPPMTPDEIAELAKKNLPDRATFKADGTIE